MQTVNVDRPVVVTVRNESIPADAREVAIKKVQSLHLDYPRIMEVKVVLDVQDKHGAPRHFAEVVLFCTNNITIEADSTSQGIYAAIDETMSKIARRMRKYKTRIMKHHRPKHGIGSIRNVEDQTLDASQLEL
jgi:putative sigma-54 modulation protein